MRSSCTRLYNSLNLLKPSSVHPITGHVSSRSDTGVSFCGVLGLNQCLFNTKCSNCKQAVAKTMCKLVILTKHDTNEHGSLSQNVLRQWATTWIFLIQNVLRQWGFDQFWCDPWNATLSGVFWYFAAFFKWTHSYLCSQNGCKCWNLLLYATHFLHRFAQYWRIYFTRLTFTFWFDSSSAPNHDVKNVVPNYVFVQSRILIPVPKVCWGYPRSGHCTWLVKKATSRGRKICLKTFEQVVEPERCRIIGRTRNAQGNTLPSCWLMVP